MQSLPLNKNIVKHNTSIKKILNNLHEHLSGQFKYQWATKISKERTKIVKKAKSVKLQSTVLCFYIVYRISKDVPNTFPQIVSTKQT